MPKWCAPAMRSPTGTIQHAICRKKKARKRPPPECGRAASPSRGTGGRGAGLRLLPPRTAISRGIFPGAAASTTCRAASGMRKLRSIRARASAGSAARRKPSPQAGAPPEARHLLIERTGRTRSGLAQPRIDAVGPCPVGNEEEEAARNGDILRKQDHLNLIIRLKMEEQRGNNAETCQQQGDDPRLPADKNGEPAQELDNDHQRQEYARHADRLHVTGRPRISGNFTETGGHEQIGHKDTADEIEERV